MLKESNIQSEIMLWCGQNNILCFRCNVGKFQTATGRWIDTGLPEGFSDLIILHNKTIYFCEVKTKTGRQRQAQIDFQRIVESHGYCYFVARSVDDVIKAIK